MQDIRTTKPRIDSIVEDRGPAPDAPATHRLDSPEFLTLFKKLRDWYLQEWTRQAANRYQMAMDEDYYDSMQWSAEEAQVLMDRGQFPSVYNEIKPSIDWMIGTERRTRIDYKVMARRKDGADDAEVKTKLLKYLSDVNKSTFHRSRAFGDAIKAGLGVLEVGLRGDPTDELLFTRFQDWRALIYDSNSVEVDWSDARYVFRFKDLDEDVALAYFPDRADVVKSAARNLGQIDIEEQWYLGTNIAESGEDWHAPVTGKYSPYDGSAFTHQTRPVVRFYECWYRQPVARKAFASGPMRGERYDPQNPEHVAQGESSLYDKLEMEIRVCIYTQSGVVFEGPSPYQHGRLPFVPVWCYRRKRDNAPYGMIRAMRDPQDALNKRNSKAIWILSTNQIEMEVGAVDDIDELREQAADPSGIIIRNPGKALNMRRDIALAEEHLKLMDRDANYLRQVGGVTAENLGRATNATSGIAIQNRQDQGSVVTTEAFDNLRYAVQQVGEMELSLVEQFYSDAKVVRLVGDRGQAQYTEINAVDPATGAITNDVTAMHADFIVSEQDWRSSLRQAMFESLFDLVGRLAQMNPQVALSLLDLVVEMGDFPNRDELVARIRKISGQRDPDAEVTPEDQAQEQAQAQVQQAQQQIAMETMRVQLAELIAKRDKLDSEAVMKRVEAMYSALQAAQVVAAAPGISPIADQIMRGSGFADMSADADAKLIAKAGATLPSPVQDLQQPAPTQGMQRGIETKRNDGVM